MSGEETAYSLDCPECSCKVFERDEDLFGDGEEDYCAGCGALVRISTDAESPVDVVIDEHGGDVVARLRAELDERGAPSCEEIARLIAITGQRHWSRGGEHDATDVAEAIAELAQRELERLTRERDALEARLVDADAVLVRAGLVGSASDVAAALARIASADARVRTAERGRVAAREAQREAEEERALLIDEPVAWCPVCHIIIEPVSREQESSARCCSGHALVFSVDWRERAEAAERELADEQAFHAKTADNFEEAAAGWSEERERLTRERDDAVRRAETDGRTCVKMGTRNREMMGERDEARREIHERQRECALARARDGLQRFGADKAIDARAREIAEAAGWSCYGAEGEQP
jgi:hypothetical protein